MHHRLSCRRAVVDADVETIGCSLGHQLATDQRYELPKGFLLLFGQLEQAGDVPLGNDERVAFCDRKCVEKSCRNTVLQVDVGLIQVTKGASVLIHDTI